MFWDGVVVRGRDDVHFAEFNVAARRETVHRLGEKLGPGSDSCEHVANVDEAEGVVSW